MAAISFTQIQVDPMGNPVALGSDGKVYKYCMQKDGSCSWTLLGTQPDDGL